MKKINIAVITLTLFLSTLMGVQAEHVKQDKTYKYYNLKKNEEIIAEFPHEIPHDKINLTDATLISSSDGVYKIKINEDMEEFILHLSHEEGIQSIQKEHEAGLGTSHGSPGSGSGGDSTWESVKLGKHSWQTGNRINFAIRIDMEMFLKYDEIFVEDVARGVEYDKDSIDISIRALRNNDGITETVSEIPFEIIELEPNTFSVKIVLKDSGLSSDGEWKIDLVYWGSLANDNEPYANKYRVYTNDEHGYVESGGSGFGQLLVEMDPIGPEQPPASTETPKEPEDLEKPDGEDTEAQDKDNETPKVEESGGDTEETPGQPDTNDDSDNKHNTSENNKEVGDYVSEDVEQKKPTNTSETSSENTTKEDIGTAAFIEPATKQKPKAEEVSHMPVDTETLPQTGVSSTLGKIGILLVAAGVIMEAMKCSIKED